MTAESDPELTIWVVDPSTMGRRLISRVLEGRGYAMRGFATAQALLDATEDDLPECVITALRMDDLDGLVLAERLRRRAAKDELAIIVLSTEAEAAETARAAELAIGAWLRPPVPPQILCEVVRSVVSG